MDDIIKNLIKKININICDFTAIKNNCIIFINGNDFIIINNNCGVIASGSRAVNREKTTLYYNINILNNDIKTLKIKNLIRKREKILYNLWRWYIDFKII